MNRMIGRGLEHQLARDSLEFFVPPLAESPDGVDLTLIQWITEFQNGRVTGP